MTNKGEDINININNNNYQQFVIVAETEWGFDYGVDLVMNPAKDDAPIFAQSVRLGSSFYECNITSNFREKTLEFSCQGVDDVFKEVHMELVCYQQRLQHQSKSYEKNYTVRHIFTRSTNSLVHNLLSGAGSFTLRILKNRSMFPDFTLESTVIERRFGADGKLRVGDQIFHVNKRLLSVYSMVFDQMFNNGGFSDSYEEVIELKHEPADAAVFHDFLLVMCVPEALPNPNNVAALSVLADMYQVKRVRDKCQLHLWTSHEMPLEKRYLLALENGNKELQTSIRRNMNLEEADRIIVAVSEKAIAY